MDIIISLCLLTLFFVSVFFSRNIFFSALFALFMSELTSVGSLSAIFILIAILVGWFLGKIKISYNNLLIFLMLLAMLTFCLVMAIPNGAHIYNIIGKFLRLFIILFLFFISYEKSCFSIRDVFINIRSFIGISIVSVPLLYSMGYYDDAGIVINRVSGFMYDANYFALYCMIFMVFLKYFSSYLKRSYVDLLLLSFLILLSQSWSIIIFTVFVYLFYKNNILIYLAKKLNPYMSIIAIFSIWTFFKGRDKLEILDDWDTSYLSLKINSVFFRFNSSFDGFLHMQDNSHLFWFGMGNGRSLEVSTKVFHNLYFQQFFDHGFFYYMIMSLLLFYITKCSIKVPVIQLMIFIFFINNFLFDNFYSFIFSFTLFLFLMSENYLRNLKNELSKE